MPDMCLDMHTHSHPRPLPHTQSPKAMSPLRPKSTPAVYCHPYHLQSEEKPLPVDISELSLLALQRPLQDDCLLDPVSAPSFISRLPYELITHIFLYCLPTHQFLIPSSVQAPLLLTQICALWRTIALHTPALWASLHVNYHDPARDVAFTNLWLSRSANLPLSLSLSIDFNERRHQAIINALQAHSPRWRHIRFDFRHLLCPPKYSLGRATGDTPILQTFQFHASDISNDNLSPITKLLSASPALREVAWIDDLANTDTMLELPLSRLTRLSLAMARGTLDYLEVLDQCPNLEHIRITRPCANALPPRPPLLLAKLTSLNISYDLTSILDHLVLPALKHVRIHAENDRQYGVANSGIGTGSGSSWSPESFLSLIDRSACSVVSLSLNAPMTEDALVQVLQRTSSSLAQLSVVGIAVTDKLLAALTPPVPSAGDQVSLGYICPGLEELDLDTKVVSTSGQLARMIETRLALRSGDAPPDPGGVAATHARKIRSVRILDGPRDLRRLQELKDQCKLASLEVVPRKESKPRRRNFVYRRKVCVSR